MKIKYIFAIMVLALLNGCFPLTSVTNASDKNGCVQPLYDVAFPIVTPQRSASVIPRQIAPQGDWQVQDALPVPQDELGVLLARPIHGELWLTTRSGIYRYFIDEKQWKTYRTVDETSIIPDILFITRDDTVWGFMTRIKTDAHSGKHYPLLSRFNDVTDRFDYVEDISGFLQRPQVRLLSNIIENPSGLLWFIVQGEKDILVSFDEKTNQS